MSLMIIDETELESRGNATFDAVITGFKIGQHLELWKPCQEKGALLCLPCRCAGYHLMPGGLVRVVVAFKIEGTSSYALTQDFLDGYICAEGEMSEENKDRMIYLMRSSTELAQKVDLAGSEYKDLSPAAKKSNDNFTHTQADRPSERPKPKLALVATAELTVPPEGPSP